MGLFDASLLERSFDLCVITQNQVAECHQPLNAVYTTGVFEQIEENDGTSELNALNEVDPAAFDHILEQEEENED